ncbi:hypothetical protein Ciccas_010910 [Cichlidogyrus casuarinus]|uniref:Uncharacterized protein n=1 Tax=Cichlidogyrus casuarinus TaxID=1844966 RepID=A0ABD2PTD3_9PLAT
MNRRELQLGKKYLLKLYSVNQVNGLERVNLIGQHPITFKNNVYYQDFMDKLAEDIAKDFNNSMDKKANLRRELAQLARPWSQPV